MNLMDLFIKIGVDDQASGKISSLSKKLGSGLKTAAKAATTAIAAVGSGIMAIGTYAAKVGGDFEAQMSKVSAISGATGDDLQALEDKAKQLGIDTKFSATEAGQAFEYMAMAGWKTEQMLDGVAGIMDLAAASGEDLAMVSDIVTDAMTAFGLSADQSTHFADVLAQASSNANTNVALLGESFKYVAPVAGALGYSVEDTATALGLMANAGIKGSQAGTALRAALSSMLDASDPVYTAMMQLGLATEDTVTALVNEDGASKSLAETMRILRDAFSGLTEAEQAEYAANIFGREAMSGMLAIINTSDAEFEKLTNSIYNADGAAKKMADTMANNLQGQLTLLKSSAEGFGLALYDKIQKPLTKMASWAVESLNKLTRAFNENGVDGVVEAAGNILSEAMTAVVEKLPEFVNLAVSVIESFVSGLSKNQNSIVSGIVSIVKTIITGLTEIIPQIIELCYDMMETLARALPDALIETLPRMIDGIVGAIASAFNSFGKIIRPIIEALPDMIMMVVNSLVRNLPILIDGIITLVLALVDALPDIMMAFTDATPMVIELLIASLLEAIPQIIKGLLLVVGQLVVELPNILKSLVNGFTGIFVGIWNGITSVFDLKKVGAFFSNVWSGIKSAFGSVADWFSSVFTKAWEGVKQVFSAGGKIFTGIKDGIVSAFKAVVNAIIKGINTVVAVPFNAINAVLKKLKGIDILGLKPFGWISTFTVPQIPLLARGGVLEKGQIGLLEGTGAEAVVPLENNKKWVSKVAKDMAEQFGGIGGSVYNINISVDGAKYSDEQSLAEAIAETIQNMTDRKAAVYA